MLFSVVWGYVSDIRAFSPLNADRNMHRFLRGPYKVMREARIRHAGLGLGSIGSMTARHHDPTNHPSTKGYIPEIQSDKKPR